MQRTCRSQKRKRKRQTMMETGGGAHKELRGKRGSLSSMGIFLSLVHRRLSQSEWQWAALRLLTESRYKTLERYNNNCQKAAYRYMPFQSISFDVAFHRRKLACLWHYIGDNKEEGIAGGQGDVLPEISTLLGLFNYLWWPHSTLHALNSLLWGSVSESSQHQQLGWVGVFFANCTGMIAPSH